MTQPRIAVVGGGIAGLSLALNLHQRGLACDVYESVPEVRELGVGITLLPHAMRELAALGLQPALEAVGIENLESVFFNRFGQFIYREPRGRHAGYAVPEVGIHRGKLHRILFDAALQRLDSQLTPALAERLLSAVDRAQTAAAARVEIQDSGAPHRPMATSAISKRWPPWLQRLRQPLGEQPPEPIEAVQRSGAARPVARPAATKPGPAGAPSSATDRGGGVASPVQERGDQGPEAPSSTDGTTPGPASAALHQASVASDAHVRRAAALPWLAEASFSARGGLLLLLNLLQSLGFERQALAEPGCADALFLSLLDDAEPDLHDDVPRDVQTELFDARHAGNHLRLTRLWTLRLRRALRGHARMDLAELLQRPAWVGASPTHIDVIFALDSVDLRLRRLGLDSDPGWLPWFGRIVAFHFLGAELLPPEPGHG